jgi:single-stranded-DNA-specific exonuclease
VAMYYGKKAAPVFAGEAALIRVSSACQIHPLIAQIWRSRLPKYYVLVANDAYLPGRVNFAARSVGDKRVLQFLRSFELETGEGSYARGHDHASGGSVPLEAWNQLLKKIGFNEEVLARSPG